MIGSIQLRRYLAARATMDRAEAAELVGFSLEEARLTDIANEKGEIELPSPPPTHNQKEPDMGQESVAADELRLLIERVERLEEEKKAISDDVKDVYAEAKSRGYDTKAIRKIIAIRKKKNEEFAEEQAILETYMAALGMLAGTALGDYALSKAA